MVNKSFFRKVAFGINPNEEVPANPLSWAQGQVHNTPPLTWEGLLPEQKELRRNQKFHNDEEDKLEKKFKNDDNTFEEAIRNLSAKTGRDYYEALEINIRHHAAIHSGSPVFERLLWFWANHFAALETANPWFGFTGEYHRNVLRKNLTGSFSELVTAATTSRALLESLDNSDSVGPNSIQGRKSRKQNKIVSINENHARELLELHTVSSKGGYTQQDVINLSKIMTGWQAHDNSPVKFNQKVHEPGEHIVYGKGYKQKGSNSKNKLLDVIPDLCARPSCREFITIKLCRHFICDEPSEEMIAPIIEEWERTDGHLPSVHSALLEVIHYHNNNNKKFLNPEIWLVQLANMFDLNYPVEEKVMNYNFSSYPRVQRRIIDILEQIGHNPYRPRQPNGWPDTELEWVSPELIARRFQYPNKLMQFPLYKRRFPATDLNTIFGNNFENPEEIISYISKNNFDMDEFAGAVKTFATTGWSMYA